MVIIATVVMLFAAFTAALLVRRGGPDWIPIRLPDLVWFNTAALLASTIAVEGARGAMRRGTATQAASRLAVAIGLGLVFFAGQVIAWRLLADRGVFLNSNPHASFFYMLSAVHAAHVVGGLGSLGWTLRRLANRAYTAGRHAGLVHAAVFWHLLGAVWLYLLLALSIL
jgi:cytochrome c oxidase subunit 3